MTKITHTQIRKIIRRELALGLKCEYSLNSPVRPEAKEPTAYALSGFSLAEYGRIGLELNHGDQKLRTEQRVLETTEKLT